MSPAGHPVGDITSLVQAWGGTQRAAVPPGAAHWQETAGFVCWEWTERPCAQPLCGAAHLLGVGEDGHLVCHTAPVCSWCQAVRAKGLCLPPGETWHGGLRVPVPGTPAQPEAERGLDRAFRSDRVCVPRMWACTPPGPVPPRAHSVSPLQFRELSQQCRRRQQQIHIWPEHE